jgi:hypothetical protein
LLGQHRRDEPLLPGDLSPVRLDLTPDQPQEGSLAGAIPAQQAKPLTGVYGKVGPIRDRRAAKAQSNLAQRNERH